MSMFIPTLSLKNKRRKHSVLKNVFERIVRFIRKEKKKTSEIYFVEKIYERIMSIKYTNKWNNV